MAISQADFENLTALALQLSAIDKLKLIARLTVALETEITPANASTHNPMLMIAEAAERLGLSADQNDLSERFDDELRATWGDHLANKWDTESRPD